MARSITKLLRAHSAAYRRYYSGRPEASKLHFLLEPDWRLKITKMYPDLVDSRHQAKLLFTLYGPGSSEIVMRYCSESVLSKTSNWEILAIYTIIKSLNVRVGQVKSFVNLMTSRPIDLLTSWRSFNELGIQNADTLLLKDFSIVYDRSISALKALGHIPKNYDVLENIFCLLGIENDSCIRRTTKDLSFLPIKELFHHVLLEYLKLRLPLELKDDWEQCEPSVDHPVNFENVPTILKILESEFNFSPQSVYDNRSWIFALQPFNVELIRKKLLHNYELVDVIKKCPQILTISYADLNENINALSASKIHPSTLDKHFHLIRLPPRLLSDYLHSVVRYPELAPLLIEEDFEQVLDDIDLVRHRITYLNKLRIPLPPISTLISPYENFVKFLSGDRKSSNMANLVYSLKGILKLKQSQITSQLRRHIVNPSINTQAVLFNIRQLQATGYSMSQISNALWLLTFDWNDIATVIKELPNDPTVQPFERWEGHSNLLQLVLYKVDKKVNPMRTGTNC